MCVARCSGAGASGVGDSDPVGLGSLDAVARRWGEYCGPTIPGLNSQLARRRARRGGNRAKVSVSNYIGKKRVFEGTVPRSAGLRVWVRGTLHVPGSLYADDQDQKLDTVWRRCSDRRGDFVVAGVGSR